MAAEDNAAVARAWAHAAWLQHDLDAAGQYLAPDWVGHYAGIGDAHGVDGFKRIAKAYLRAFPNLTITVHDAFGAGDRLVRRVSYAGTHRGVFLGVAPMSLNAIATPAAREPGAPSDSLAKPELARKFHDNAVRCLPGAVRGRDRGPNARPS